jgi:ABC-2 type transport system permease protein
MSAFTTHFAVEFRTGIRNKMLLFLNYIFPLGFYLMMGLIMTQINPLFTDTMVPSMVTFAVLAATVLGLADPLVSAREAGILRSYRINGIPALPIVIMPALTMMLHLTLVAIIITVTATPFFGAPAPVNYAALALVFVCFSLAAAGLGILIGVIAPNSRVTVILSQAIFLPAMLLGGLMIPYDMLPASVQQVAMLLPTTYAMNAFNGLAMGYTPTFDPWLSLLLLVAGGLVSFLLAVYLFNWDSRNDTRRGHPLLALLALLPYAAGILLL